MFHPMQHPHQPHHPQQHYPPHHMQHPAPLAVDPRPISEIYCDSMKRKNHQEKSENTPPYWYAVHFNISLLCSVYLRVFEIGLE